MEQDHRQRYQPFRCLLRNHRQNHQIFPLSAPSVAFRANKITNNFIYKNISFSIKTLTLSIHLSKKH